MALTRGSRVGPYEVTTSIGAGGMGEVFRARDTKLNRDVALKVLPDSFANDPDRLARFTREAQTLAALNHPNIAHIHGLEESGGLIALVMELAEGEDLSQRIARGAMPLDEALPIAKQIADALEAAHEKGVVHRDLKPSNIKITADGVVKVLDFGLAKAFSSDNSTALDAANSPTIVSPAQTELGLILGTAAYMAPEQAKGRAVDKRADIWAFGVVLYEMLTGRRLFGGDSTMATIASVIKDELPLDHLPAHLPPAIRQLVARCLDRDPRRRLRDIGEARIVLANRDVDGIDRAPASRVAAKSRLGLALLIGAGLAVATATAAWVLKPPPAGPLRRFELAPPVGSAADYALAPDGSRIAYIDNAHLFVLSLDEPQPRDLGTVHVTAAQPFWAPDGRTIGFTAGGAINTIPAAGGAILQVCRIPATGRALDLTWLSDGTILFATWRENLYSVPAGGGTPVVRVAVDPKTEIDFHSVSALPDGRLILTTHLRGPNTFRTDLLGADADHRRTTISSDAEILGAKFTPPDRLLYARLGANAGVWAAPFDGTSADFSRAFAIARGGSQFDADAAGTLVARLPPAATMVEFVWLDRTGAVTRAPGDPFPVSGDPVLSPDGTRVAFVVGPESDSHLTVRELKTGMDTRVTPAGPNAPTQRPASWFPSSDEVLFTTGVVEARRIVARRTDGSGGARSIVGGVYAQVTPDRRGLVLLVDERGATRLRYAPFLSDGSVGTVQRIIKDADPIVDWFDLSPDGSMAAYTVREADERLNTFLTDVPAGARQWQVTTVGGGRPHFSPDGRQLFYLGPATPLGDPPRGALIMRSIEWKPALILGVPIEVRQQALTGGDLELSLFDVARDGRILTFRPVGTQNARESRLVLIQNWNQLSVR